MTYTRFTSLNSRRLACTGLCLTVVAHASALAAAPASADRLALHPYAPSDWIDVRTATVDASVVGLPEGTPVSIEVARGIGETCPTEPRHAQRTVAVVRGARTFDPTAADAATQPAADLIATVQAPAPGAVGTACGWASLPDGSTLRARALLRTPRHLRVGSTTAAAPFDPLRLARRLHLGQLLLGVAALCFMVRLPFRAPRLLEAAVGRLASETRRALRRAPAHAKASTLDSSSLEALAARSAVGEAAEELVREELTAVEDRGGVVYNNVYPPGGGNVDHVVRMPEGHLWSIETKAGSEVTARALEQAARNARRVAALAGVAPDACQAVLCLARRTTRQVVPYEVDGTIVLVVGLAGLLPLLLGGSPPVPPPCEERRRSRWTAARAF